MRPGDDNQFKEESFRWILTVLLSICTFLVAAYIAVSVYQPDIVQLNQMATDVLADPRQAIPEPMEALLFRLGVLVLVPSLVFFYSILSRRRFAFLHKGWSFDVVSIVSVALLLVVGFAGFLLGNRSDSTSRVLPITTDGAGDSNFRFFFDGFFLGNYFWVYALILFPAILWLFFMEFGEKRWDENNAIVRVVNIVGYAVIGITLVLILAMNIFSFPYSVENRYDLAAVYYSVTQVFAGSPMLFDGFTNTYGLYPHFLVPIFKVAGLSVLSFSVTMSVLLVVAFILNFHVLKRYVSNRFILFAGFATMLFFGYLDRKLLNHFNNFFALFPIRYIIPSVLLLLADRYVNRPSRAMYFTGSSVLAACMLWNPEIGMTCYLAWLAMHVYRDFWQGEGGVNFAGIIRHMVVALVTAGVVFIAYMLLIYLGYGAWPDLRLLVSTMGVFSATGFGMLPMEVIHPWNLVALIILFGFLYAIARWWGREATPRTCMVLLLALISLGYFVYFQGRSHNTSLSSSSGFCIMLLTILANELWLLVKEKRMLLHASLFGICLFLLSFSLVELVVAAPREAALIGQGDDATNYADVRADMEAGRQLIERTSGDKEKVLVLAQKKHQAFYFEGGSRRSAFNPGIMDLFLRKDAERLAQVISDSSFSLYWEASDIHYPFMTLPYAALAASYEYRGYDRHSLVWLTKRRTHIPARSFFQPDSALLYRKYLDGRESDKKRMKDAVDGVPVMPGEQFSVQLVVYNEGQMFPDAAIVGIEQGGLSIGRVFNASKFFFAINGTSQVIPVPENSWLYLVVNVFADRFDVFGNGLHMCSQPLLTPMPAAQRAYIGNMPGNERGRYYVGPIAEVSIQTKTIDSTQVAATWEDIKAGLVK